MKKTVILAILDGWGIGRNDRTNPIYTAGLKNIPYFKNNFPTAALQAAGIAVGLPWEEAGNSETGHLNIGAGKIIYQNFPRISLSLRDESFFKNEVFKEAFSHAKQNSGIVHLAGLLSSSNIDSSLEHLLALIKFTESEGADYRLHLFSDGMDSPQRSALSLIEKLPHPEKISSLSGRFYAMDKDEHWDRIKKAYDAIIGKAPIAKDLKSHLENNYSRNLSDEYINPALLGENPRSVKNGDSLIFFNFKEDGCHEIAMPFLLDDFSWFEKTSFNNLFIVTMTAYGNDLKAKIAFPPEKSASPLSKVISDAGFTQLKIAETEKYSQIAYFFNGLREESFKNEYRVFIPSNSVPHREEYPAMRAEEITARAIQSINESAFGFILINYANGDAIGHTGNFSAVEKTVFVVDEEIGKLAKTSLESDSVLVVVGSHGNCEYLVNPFTGVPETENTKNPVPFYLIGKKFEKSKDSLFTEENKTIGLLSDVAPTILELLEISKPKEMTGESLLKYLL